MLPVRLEYLLHRTANGLLPLQLPQPARTGPQPAAPAPRWPGWLPRRPHRYSASGASADRAAAPLASKHAPVPLKRRDAPLCGRGRIIPPADVARAASSAGSRRYEGGARTPASATCAAIRPSPSIGVPGRHARLAWIEAFKNEGETQMPEFDLSAGQGVAGRPPFPRLRS
jgi:hypothetical protein